MSIPYLDCNNHNLNLEVKQMIEADKSLKETITSIHELMVSIKRSHKNTVLLRKLAPLTATIDDKTR